ncbi:Ion-trans domain containing protein [Pyrenophora tritici-repentis]|nr:Ion-trans domain containing protein [Pyrenophora tritici-repentis]KAI1550101.1 Ion-trans domain containing protein [Pyrenophora tritici-repentis]KAI1598820.1 Ion-trans domain containing protein [Pyrenophora tritici-repentis]KAI1600725.1 Ion-trans domain containing protein [Pyrenophora tritici-repentis]
MSMSHPPTPKWPADEVGVPSIEGDECFGDLVDKLCQFFEHTIKLPHAFEDLRRSQEGRALQPLIHYLSNQVDHPALVSALLALKGHFSALEEASDEPGVNEARGYACEFVAWQFLTSLKEADIIDFLLVELPPAADASTPDTNNGLGLDENGQGSTHPSEQSPLLATSNTEYFDHGDAKKSRFASLMSQCENLSALELATVSGAKKFLSQRPVQKIINGLWKGDIVFWETLGLHSVKKPKKYNRRQADPFSRLRVPLYLKIFETLFFAAFLALYYAVLVKRNNTRVTIPELLLYVWIASFAYDEFADWLDAGQTSFYASDFWWTWDISIVVVGFSFCIMRIVGLTTANAATIDLAYDVLGLEALFLVPRIFSLLSLNRYFGTLIPCLKEMTKDFVKFLSLVVILYLGFLTTFVLLARDSRFNPKQMSWILVKVFFGSSYLGFGELIPWTTAKGMPTLPPPVANKAVYRCRRRNVRISLTSGVTVALTSYSSPFFGPPVMLIFVTLTNILLITSLISLLSNSLSKVLDHARDEYLFIYSVYVLEASSSKRLTYFLPPLNLIPLVIRPLRLILPSERLRGARIVLLKATHLPFVFAIWAFEHLAHARTRDAKVTSFSGPQTHALPKRPPRLPVNSPRLLMADAQSNVGRMQQMNWSHTRAGFTEPDAQLKTLVARLSTQVEELTAMVSQLQDQREASTSAA